MKINRTIRDGGQVFRPGSEKELDAYLTPEQGERLLKSKAIEGKGWNFTGTGETETAAQSTPDNGEVERLRTQVTDLTTERDTVLQERNDLAAQLTKAQAEITKLKKK